MKGKKGKIASVLLAGSMMFLPVCCQAEAEPTEAAAVENEAVETVSAHEIEKKTTTIYYGNAEEEN